MSNYFVYTNLARSNHNDYSLRAARMRKTLFVRSGTLATHTKNEKQRIDAVDMHELLEEFNCHFVNIKI